MKKYKLKKDLPTFKAGEEFEISQKGNLIKRGDCVSDCIVAYSAQTLEKFPNILTEWFEEVRVGSKTIMDLKYGDKYYYISTDDAIYKTYYYGFPSDFARIDAGNAFLCYRSAEKALVPIKAKRILIRDTKGFKPNIYNLDQKRYYVSYDPVFKELYCCHEGHCYVSHEIIFATKEDATESINKHEKEWLIYLGVEE